MVLYFFLALLLCAFLGFLIIPIYIHKKAHLFKSPCSDMWIFSIIVITGSIGTILLYLNWGASQSLAESSAISRTAMEISHEPDTTHQVNQVTQKFLAYLAKHPEDSKGWYLLGRLYLDQANISKAAAAFKNSLKNDPQNIEVMAQYAQVLYLVHHQKLTQEALQIAQKVLAQDPKNVTVLNLLAADAFSHHRHQLAMTYWKRLRSQYPEDSAEFTTLTQAIEICKNK